LKNSIDDICSIIFVCNFRDALAIRLYSVRMLNQFISTRKLADELADFDEKTADLYMVSIVLLKKIT